MRVCLTLSVALFAAIALVAAPVPSPAPTPPPPPAATKPVNAGDAEAFANTLLQAVNWVAEIYVRPVSREDLLQTALTALYDGARRPVPGDLRRRIDRAAKEAAALALKDTAAAPPPAPLVPGLAPKRPPVPKDRPVLDLIRAVRAETGAAEHLSGEPPLHLCCQTMLRGLDPYSSVINPSEDNLAHSFKTEHDGFGLEVSDGGAHRLVVKEVLPGGPAQQAGLRPGDEIVRVQDAKGRERKLKEALELLNARPPAKPNQPPVKPNQPPVKPNQDVPAKPDLLQVTFRHRGVKEECRATLNRIQFQPESVFGVVRRDDNSWDYWLDAERKIAHLRLGQLVETTPDELSEILAYLCRDGLRGLVLDLRWCPGGSLKGSVKSAELFLSEGTIATIHNRAAAAEEVFRSVNEDKLTDFPIVVLINSDSIGGAELIAAALQDHHRAVLVGQRTHGKGNVQRLQSFGTVTLKVTSGTIVRPSDKALHRFPDSKPGDDWGVHPDRPFRISPDLGRALKTWWEQQTLRPGSSTERLPLDDPLADPQRNAAGEKLRELLDAKEKKSEE